MQLLTVRGRPAFTVRVRSWRVLCRHKQRCFGLISLLRASPQVREEVERVEGKHRNQILKGGAPT